MKTIKQEAIDAIASLPDTAEIDDIMYRLYVIDKIRQGQKDIREENSLVTEELKKQISEW